MNITEALNSALPEMPARLVSQRYPRIHPEVVFKEHIQDGETVVRALVPGIDAMYTFPPKSWQLIQLFDGKRSYEEVADIYSGQTGTLYTADTVRDFAADVDAMNFWYKTPQEKNVKLMQKTAEERRKLLKKKNSWGDLSLIKFPAVDPDRFLTWLYRHVRFMYTGWFTAVTLVAFAFTAGIFITHWSEIGRDTLQFYNFADKSWADVATFWLVGAVLLCIHEIGHGLTCKHYGARVPAMGFLLIYLTPAFYTDTTEGEVRGTQYQRLMIAVAGVWAELLICAVATPVWWGTAPGTAVHDFAYTIILLTGIAVVLINWNPLMKLDGYYILCELLGISDLKESSTLYVSAWVKKNVWQLPVEVPYVPKRRRLGFATYAILSGLYSYSVLYVFASFIGNVSRVFNPDFAFVFELGTAYLIFRGRLRTLWNFMKFLYLDKKDRIRAWFTPQRKLAVAATAGVFALLPIWHESAGGRFVLEPVNRAVIRALVPGTVTAVYADEGEPIAANATLLRLSNLPLQSRLARSLADYQLASARTTSAVLRYEDFGTATRDRDRLAEQTRDMASEVSYLELRSPMSGVVTTPRVKDRLGSFVREGTELAEVADLSSLRARIDISEHDMSKFKNTAFGRLQIDGMFGKWDAQSVTIAAASSQAAAGLMDLNKYAGMRPPNFYVVDLTVANSDRRLAPGMIGTARLYGRRRSLAGLAGQTVLDFFGRKVW